MGGAVEGVELASLWSSVGEGNTCGWERAVRVRLVVLKSFGTLCL